MQSVLEQLLHQLADPSSLDWNDETYDLANARGLNDNDRTSYVAQLIANAGHGDSRALLTLGHLHANEALPMLRALSRSNVAFASTARRALVLLGRGLDVADEIARDALQSPAKMVRVAAVMDLAKVGGATAISALEQALADKDDAVRVRAWDGLIAVFELESFLQSPAGKREKTTHLELLRDFLSSDLDAFQRMGAEEMRAIIHSLKAGATPTSLNLDWISDPAPAVSDQILQAIIDEETAYPVDKIANLTGVPRRWAEAALALRADSDLRVPAALARLHATWTLPVLQEVATAVSTSPELRAQLQLALKLLQP